jgi:hypothetical protein
MIESIRTRVVVTAVILVVAAAVVAVVLLTRGDGTQEGFVAAYRRTADPRTIELVVTTGPRHEIVRAELMVEGDRVVVSVRVRPPDGGGSGNSSGVDKVVPVRLDEDLGQRSVVDTSGRVVLEWPPSSG